MDSDLKMELKREIEFNMEKEKLKEVIFSINEETHKYVYKRKEITNNLLDYRKKVVEEYRDDEDKLIEYFDHEKFVQEESYRLIDKKLKELTILRYSPYFGRVDFREDDFGIESIYVGRFGLTPQDSYDPIVVDWRAPIASIFYQGKLGEAAYKAPVGEISVDILSKRQYVIKNSLLKGMFDSALDIKDDILQMILSKNAGDKLKDIVMTIQKEQDDIIREEYLKTIVVDGVAGSGKTTIALHRIAYLLYNYRKELQDKILILGPNGIFMEYIANVLPSLGETGVKQNTFWDMALNLLDLEEEILPYKDYVEELLKGNKDEIEHMIYKNSEDYIEKLDLYLKNLEEGYFNIEKLMFKEKEVYSIEEIMELFNKHYKYMPLFRRSAKIRRIIFARLKDFRDEEIRRINEEHKKVLESLSPQELNLNQNNLEFQRRTAIRDVIRELIETKKTLKWLDNKQVIDLYKEFNREKNLTVDDLAPILYFKIKLEGYKLKDEIKHVVIDEAQDLSKLQFLVIKELTGCSAFTILGDSNQRILPLKGVTPMKQLRDIYGDLDVKHFNLSKSYRSTQEIMEYANRFLKEDIMVPLVRTGEPVVEKKVNSLSAMAESIVDKLMRFKEKEYESIAIICKNLHECEQVYELIKGKIHVRLLNNDDLIYHSGSVIVPSYFAKGLEFDGVVIVSKQEEIHDLHGSRDQKINYIDEGKLNYVMATRALHELCVYRFMP